MNLEINTRRTTGKLRNMWTLNNTLLNNQCVKEEITRETRKYLWLNKNENTTYQTYGTKRRQWETYVEKKIKI